MINILLTFLLVITNSYAESTNKIAIIDTGLDMKDKRFASHLCISGHEDLTGEGLFDTVEHGTHVTGLIIKYAEQSDYCLIIIKFYSENKPASVNILNVNIALKIATDLNVNMVNFSGGGEVPDIEEQFIILNNPQTTFIVASGNDGKNLDERGNYYFPASYNFPNIISVGSLLETGVRSKTSNYGNIVKAWEIGHNVLSTVPNNKMDYKSGTSMATAIKTGKLIKKKYGNN